MVMPSKKAFLAARDQRRTGICMSGCAIADCQANITRDDDHPPASKEDHRDLYAVLNLSAEVMPPFPLIESLISRGENES